ncbi:phosphoadenosine phosphosulfate reductase [Rhodobacteraceae bacterium WD3A24]|nr:phosphoadenosine phosphosulfate reductase [Rhodobacteraceae bacterium WD3A24]
MAETPFTFDASDAQTPEEWLLRMDEIGEELGYFEPLGETHAALFIDDAPTLLVTFETVESIRNDSPEQLPLGARIARGKGWSHLCVMASQQSWYRDPSVWGYFDRLVDDAFFEDFDRVVFYGAGMGGYAAAAFSVSAPGATVLALAPQATLTPDLAGWDQRFAGFRRLDFTSRYGFAPDMTEGAGDVFILHDPTRSYDAMHAALFHRPYVRRLRCPHLGANIEAEFAKMGILEDLIRAACEGRLEPGEFHRLYRARRRHAPYLIRLAGRAQAAGRAGLTRMACRRALEMQDHPRLRRMLAWAESELGLAGAGA